MALLSPLADSVRMSATFGVDAHPSFYPNPVDVSETENSSHVILSFHSSGPEEVFQKPILDVVEVNNSSESQEESPLPPVRRKRAIRRYADCSSEDEYFPKSVRRRSQVRYQESDSSSEGESDYGRLPHVLSSSKQERSQKLKLVLELLSQSKTIETVLHVGCRIRSLEAAATKPDLPLGVLRGCPSCRSCQKVVASWRPDAGRRPCLDEAPVFYPNEEEFKHPLKYIASIRSRAEPYGICRVVPPRSWRPPCPLQEDSPELQSMHFSTRVQQVHKLQVREPSAREYSPAKQASKKRRGRSSLGRMGGSATCTASAIPDDHQEFFGFEPGDPFPLGAFEKYANDFKDQYFRSSEWWTANSEQKWEPTVEMIEGEYWRIVEQATDQIEVLYGADVETGKYGSGFPKAKPGAEAATSYEKSGWNLNNIARFPGSMLSFEEGDISGVLVPWLYIGMCFSSFCWHVEDHHFYSLNYMHWGAPKVWYGVPGSAADKLEAAMKKHLPDLFNEQPDLLHKLVTQLSPSFLKEEGVPVYRLVQGAGDFVITFPHAYHAGFNSGFNVAEAVNVAPVDWLPHGQAAVELYRELHRKTSVSHDKLLLGAARVAVKMWWHSQQNQTLPPARDTSWMSQPQTKDARNETSSGQADGWEPGLVCAWQAYCGEGGVLAKALKERVEMEHARRESVRVIAGEASPLSMKQMDSSYDATDERECEICKYDLHLSAVGCQCCPDKFACLLHGHLLCSCPWSKKTLFYRYHLDQLGLLLAAVEGRPGAVASWTNQDSQPPASSPSSLQEGVQPMHVQNEQVQGDPKSGGARPSTCLAASDRRSPTRMEFLASTMGEEGVKQKGCLPDRAGDLPKPESETTAWPISSALLESKSSIKATVSIDNRVDFLHNNGASHVCQEVKEISNQPQKVVLLKSGHAKAAGVGVNVMKQIGTAEPLPRQCHDWNLVATIQPTSPTSEKQRPHLPAPEVILLSDDEEDDKTPASNCKVNETREVFGIGAVEQLTHFAARAVDCAAEKAREGPHPVLPCHHPTPEVALRRDSLADFQSHRSGSPHNLPNDLTLQLGCGGPARGMTFAADLLPESALAAGAVGSRKQVAPAKYIGNPPFQDSALHALTSSVLPLRSEAGRPDEAAPCPRPLTDLVTVVQRNTGASWVGPRVARVRSKREVELLDTGRILVREGWHTRHAIYPAGFRSQTRFTDVEDVFQTCMYVSEIIDCGLGKGPLFKVTHPTKREVYLNGCIDECWREIQSQVNEQIIARRSQDSYRQLPPLLPPPIGLEMFGLTSVSIIQAVEALDPLHQCSEYWRGKQIVARQDQGHGFLETEVRHPGKSQGHVKQAQDPPSRDRAPEATSVNTRSRSPVNNSQRAFATGIPATGRANLASGGQKEGQDSYAVLQGFFQKASAEELRVLYRLFASETQGAEWSSAFRALTAEVQKRIL